MDLRMLLCLVLAVILALYGVLIRSIGSGTGFFLVWFALAGGFVLLALCLKFHIWEILPGIVRLLVKLGVLAGVFVLLVTQCLIFSGFFEKGEEKLDYIIVLGAQVKESGPSRVLQYRLDEAICYLEQNPETICIVSGGQGQNEPWPEAVGMREYLVAKGIDEARILTEPDSLTTEENLRNSQVFFDKKEASVGIVTNNFHVFRALRTAKKQGYLHVSGIAAYTKRAYLPNNLLRESLGIIKNFIKGNL